MPLALTELARDVLSVLAMLWLSASSTRCSSGEGASVRENDDRLSGKGEEGARAVPTQMSTSPSLELERPLYGYRDNGRSSVSSRSLSGILIEPASSEAEMSSQSESEILSNSERLLS